MLTTAVWGDSYVQSFLDHCVPTLLAPGNVPQLCSYQRGRYVICTRPRDRARIIGSTAYARLAAVLPVEIPDYRESFFIGNNYDTHNRAWRSVLQEHTVPDRWVGFITPDCFYANGSLGHFGRRFETGKKAIFGFPLRVVEETFLPAIVQEIDAGADVWSMPPRQLAELALQHLSPLTSCYLRDSRRFGHWPECLYYPVAGEGLVTRMLIGHCYAVKPYGVALDHSISPLDEEASQLEFLTDSDDYMVASLTSISHQVNWFLQRRTQDNVEAASWYNEFSTPISRQIALKPYLFHYTEMSAAKWKPVIARSNCNIVLMLLASRYAWATGQLVKAGGMTGAARLVAWILLRLGLHRACTSRERLTVLLPSDAALKTCPGLIDRLYSLPRREFARLMRHWCTADDPANWGTRDELAMLSGARLRLENRAGKICVGGYPVRPIATDRTFAGRLQLLAVDGVPKELLP